MLDCWHISRCRNKKVCHVTKGAVLIWCTWFFVSFGLTWREGRLAPPALDQNEKSPVVGETELAEMGGAFPSRWGEAHSTPYVSCARLIASPCLPSERLECSPDLPLRCGACRTGFSVDGEPVDCCSMPPLSAPCKAGSGWGELGGCEIVIRCSGRIRTGASSIAD